MACTEQRVNSKVDIVFSKSVLQSSNNYIPLFLLIKNPFESTFDFSRPKTVNTPQSRWVTANLSKEMGIEVHSERLRSDTNFTSQFGAP
jgi:hypothetical protein